MKISTCFPIFIGFYLAWSGRSGDPDPDDESNPHRNPSRCEVCKYVAQELQHVMAETGKKKETLQIGHQFDKTKKAIKYHKSELRLIEALENVCQGILKLNIHAERSSSLRFSKGESETMQTIRGLQAKGVKVDLGIPEEMWDQPSAAVSRMKQQCETLIEEEEDVISNWFFKTDQEASLADYLCAQRVLKKDEQECLMEVWTGKEKVNKETPAKSSEIQPEDFDTPPSDSETLPRDSETPPTESETPRKASEKPALQPGQTPKVQPKVKQHHQLPTPKKTRSRKKVKAGKRGKGKKPRGTKTNTASKPNKHKQNKDEL